MTTMTPSVKNRFRIIANPAAGRMPRRDKQRRLAAAARILNASVHGLDTDSPEAFTDCARRTAARCDVLVVAGGDGTFSQVINILGESPAALAFLPLGTGNALSWALGYRRRDVADAARRIRGGRVRQFDLVDCGDGKRAFMVSLGMEGSAIRNYERLKSRGVRGLPAHAVAAASAYFRDYRPTSARIALDDETVRVDALLSLMVVKQPFYGFGMKVVPQASWDDGLLHALWYSDSATSLLLGLATAATIGNRSGQYRTGRRIAINLAAPVWLQVDGETVRRGRHFTFTVLPKAVAVMC